MNVQRHILIHTRVKDNGSPAESYLDKDGTCRLCGLKSRNKDAMIAHVKKHIVKQKYKCKICQAAFPCLVALSNHYKRIHSETE